MKQLQDICSRETAKMGILTMIVYKTLIIYNIVKLETTGNNIFSPDRYNGQGIAIGYKAESNMFGTSLGNSAVAKQRWTFRNFC